MADIVGEIAEECQLLGHRLREANERVEHADWQISWLPGHAPDVARDLLACWKAERDACLHELRNTCRDLELYRMCPKCGRLCRIDIGHRCDGRRNLKVSA